MTPTYLVVATNFIVSIGKLLKKPADIDYEISEYFSHDYVI